MPQVQPEGIQKKKSIIGNNTVGDGKIDTVEEVAEVVVDGSKKLILAAAATGCCCVFFGPLLVTFLLFFGVLGIPIVLLSSLMGGADTTPLRSDQTRGLFSCAVVGYFIFWGIVGVKWTRSFCEPVWDQCAYNGFNISMIAEADYAEGWTAGRYTNQTELYQEWCPKMVASTWVGSGGRYGEYHIDCSPIQAASEGPGCMIVEAPSGLKKFCCHTWELLFVLMALISFLWDIFLILA